MLKVRVTRLVQKLFGLLYLAMAALLVHWSDGDITAAVVVAALGLWHLLSKEIILYGDYYIRIPKKKGRKS
jgi:hypothetical protein